MKVTEKYGARITSNPSNLSYLGSPISDAITKRRAATILGLLAAIAVAWSQRSNESLACTLFVFLAFLSIACPN